MWINNDKLVNSDHLVCIRQEQQEDMWVILGTLPTGKCISLGRYAHKADCHRAYDYIRDSLRDGNRKMIYIDEDFFRRLDKI